MSRFELASVDESLCCVSFFFWAVVLCFYTLGHILKYYVLTLFYMFTSSPVSTVCFCICSVSVCASPVWLCIIIVARQQMVSPCASCPPALAFPPSVLCSSVPQCLFLKRNIFTLPSLLSRPRVEIMRVFRTAWDWLSTTCKALCLKAMSERVQRGSVGGDNAFSFASGSISCLALTAEAWILQVMVD